MEDESATVRQHRPGKKFRLGWLAAAALTLTSPVAAAGLSAGCYAWGRAQVGAGIGSHHFVPMPWREGLWPVHGTMAAITLLWMVLWSLFVLSAHRERFSFPMIAIPTLAFALFGAETLRMAYTCNIF